MNVRVLDGAVFFAVLVDLMFLPYIRALSLSVSMVLVPIWCLLRSRALVNDSDYKLSLIAIWFVITSVIWAAIFLQDGFLLRDGQRGSVYDMLPNAVVTIYLFVYFIFFKTIFIRHKLIISKYLFFYLLFVFLLALIFISDPGHYFKLRSFWTMSGRIIEVGEVNSTIRFTGTLSDPNNIALLVCASACFFIAYASTPLFLKILLVPICLIIILGTMSTAGLISFIFVLFAVYGTYFRSNRGSLYRPLVGLIVLAIGLMLLITTFVLIRDNDVVSVALERSSSNSLESRIDIWRRYVNMEKISNSLLIGDGGLPLVNGAAINPHSGHLYLLYAFGLPVYLIFVWIFFVSHVLRNKRIPLFVLLLFLCFSINVGIYELRFAGLFALLIAALKAKKLYKNDAGGVSLSRGLNFHLKSIKARSI